MKRSISATLLLALLCVVIGVLGAGTAKASATITIQIDPGDTGFNDPTPVSPVGGNNGTTLGQQRLNAFQFAANIWGATLNSGPTIVINADWAALTCTSSSTVLAQSGATTIHANFPNAGFPNTWYPASLANALSGTDRNGGTPEIDITVNVNVGTTGCLENSFWYLGLDGGHGGGIDLVAVLLHEFGHGLGMQTFTSLTTGAPNGGTFSIYDRFLRDNTSGKLWPEMTNAERVASAKNTGNLAWAGNQVTTDSPTVLGTPRLRINSPGAIAGNYSVGTADFGPSLSSPGVTANVVRVLDAADGAGPSTTDGCSSFTNAAQVSGNIAFIDRGSCNFIDKVKNAQSAGAVGVIIGNVPTSPNPSSTQIMGAAGPPVLITIPSVHLALGNADAIRSQFAANPNASITLDHSILLGADAFNRVLMYAPTTLASGSSVSHFDTSAYANLLMEPDDTGDLSHSVSPPQDLTFSLFRDLGWTGATSLPSIQLSSSTFNANENVGSITITVTRSGDSSGTSSVDYATSDSAGSSSCDQVTGSASARCDYLQTLGKLTFASGETSKSILIPIVDDVFTEGAETFTVTLSNANGATLGTATATVTINDGGPESGVNPIDNDATFFVRQHYIDFLNREPDVAGLNFWVDQITSCGADTQCVDIRRINVSASFFVSIEFQETGFLVYRVYKAAFSNLTTPAGAPVPVQLGDFLRDTQQISRGVQVGIGDWQTQLEANKQAYLLAFVQRSDFLADYPTNMSASNFVTQLSSRAGNGILSPAEQTSLINLLLPDPSSPTLRAQVLRAVAEDNDLKNAEFNKAFVLMQYFGYLRRNPNDFPEPGLNFDGFNFWLTKLNAFNGDYIAAEMVKAFITSFEYRRRFGPAN